MQIIDELEPARRGPYAGAVGYFDRGGDMEMCIAIRTLMANRGRVSVQAGAGIVYDSVAETEYQETVNKARAVFTAVAQAQGRALHASAAAPSASPGSKRRRNGGSRPIVAARPSTPALLAQGLRSGRAAKRGRR
jgi:anthranilate synthase component 1